MKRRMICSMGKICVLFFVGTIYGFARVQQKASSVAKSASSVARRGKAVARSTVGQAKSVLSAPRIKAALKNIESTKNLKLRALPQEIESGFRQDLVQYGARLRGTPKEMAVPLLNDVRRLSQLNGQKNGWQIMRESDTAALQAIDLEIGKRLATGSEEALIKRLWDRAEKAKNMEATLAREIANIETGVSEKLSQLSAAKAAPSAPASQLAEGSAAASPLLTEAPTAARAASSTVPVGGDPAWKRLAKGRVARRPKPAPLIRQPGVRSFDVPVQPARSPFSRQPSQYSLMPSPDLPPRRPTGALTREQLLDAELDALIKSFSKK